ncbi:hypothetical protein QEP16_25135 [Achromobacter insolitus]|uniref:hypothetical protein n=1 Tax=Achromobacter insolitus TaxID=217204 RepID=UPI00244E67FA|nr:hypothetical protein [Achromobacter insolitus]MDH3066626.1 hypothetical protein [Achromobacter insolitus]
MKESKQQTVALEPGDDAKRGPAEQEAISVDAIRAGVSMSARETVGHYGSAGAEFIKGYRGVDNDTGQVFAKGLDGISKHKVSANPAEALKNIKQQAGYSAEVAATSRDNAEAIIAGSKQRTARSDDLPEFGRNHNVVDRVQVIDGKIIDGTQTQMKFVSNRNELFSDIAREDGRFARYRGVKLELPSEQYVGAQQFCRDKAKELRSNALEAEKNGRPPEVVAKLRRDADNYDELAGNVRDSGLTTEDAIFYREHPKLATMRDIARTGHRAGMQGAQYGAIVGASVSLLKNAFAIAQDRMSLKEAAEEVAMDTIAAGAVGYGTAAIGAVTKAMMQQSSSQHIRVLANTSAPTLALNVCISLGTSIKRYATGEINETELLSEIGEKGAGMLSSGMMAALGQVVVPIPFVGAAIGGMVGYTLSSVFYHAALDAAKSASLSRERLARVQELEAAARLQLAAEQAALDAFITREIPLLQQETRQMFLVVDGLQGNGIDDFVSEIDRFATLLGKQLQFQSKAEFDFFMTSDEPLRL